MLFYARKGIRQHGSAIFAQRSKGLRINPGKGRILSSNYPASHGKVVRWKQGLDFLRPVLVQVYERANMAEIY